MTKGAVDGEPPARGERFPAIEGLRGLACLAVVAHHCYVRCGRFAWPEFHWNGHAWPASSLLYYGNGGVELFFVVSGFCLAYPLVRRPERESWWRWFAKRGYRILPPYYASIVVFWSLMLVLRAHPPSALHGASPLGTGVSAKELFVSLTLLNVFFNPSYWTLVLEARWYLVFPLLFWCQRRHGNLALMLVTLAAATGSLIVSPHAARFVLLTGQVLTYLPIFGAGMVVARWVADRSTPAWLIANARWGLLLASFGVLAVAPSAFSEGPVPRVLPWGVFAFFALLCALHDPIISRLARTPAFVAVGVFSYSLYLIHEPLVVLAAALLRPLGLAPAPQFFAAELGVLPLCVAAGFVFYQAVERPLVARARLVFARA